MHSIHHRCMLEMPKVCMVSKTKGHIIVSQEAPGPLMHTSKEVILNERASCTCFGFFLISPAPATLTAMERTMRVAFDAFVGFATVGVNPLIFLVYFVLLKNISLYISGSNSRLVNEAWFLLKPVGIVDPPFPL